MEDKFIFANEIKASWYKGYPSVGDPIQISTVYDILTNKPGLHNINPNAAKGQSFAMQFYVSDVLGGTSEDTYTNGIIGVDIDKLPKSDAEKIYNNFQLLCNHFGCLLMCCYSSSYYNPDKTTSGLHIIMRTDRNVIYRKDYKHLNTIYSAVFAYVVNEVLDIDLRPRNDDNGRLASGLDPALKSIAHRFFLNYSSLQWNEYSTNLTLEEDIFSVVKDWFDEDYDGKISWFEKKQDYKILNCEFKSIDVSGYNGGKVNLRWKGRICVINALYQWGVSERDIESILLKMCGPLDWIGDKKTPGALLRSIRQAIDTAPTQHPAPSQMEYAKYMLGKVGIDVDMIINKIYQPIDFDFDAVFEEVWNSLQDKPYHNIHYNPSNYLKINLKKDEYITDYKHIMNDMIYKYQMTYLVADCMVGKTTFGLNMQTNYGLFDGNDFIMHISGDSIDLCVPYNSVADDKSKSAREDITRVMTKQLSDFKDNKRNVFIWNTIMPLYEKYFKAGFVKRLVVFFDESQKIVTDEYRWEVVFEMFKVLPVMYKHFVFMTGTPAGELDYLKQYFKDYCVINVDKEIEFNRTCNILKYKSFGNADREVLIEDAIDSGKLPMIYSNAKRKQWMTVCKEINKKRFELGLKPYRILDYSRDNADRLQLVNETNSIKGYDIVIATKYCSVGIDFKKDDNRTRYAIVDYATEQDCTFHDIWQFTLRNRNQDTETCIVAYDDDNYNAKLYNYWYYKKLFEDMARVHTYKMVKTDIVEDDESKSLYSFAQDLFLIRHFGNLMKGDNNYFNDDRNVKLLGLYYLYKKIFSNINIIKHMLQRRGVKIVETEIEHTKSNQIASDGKKIFNWFVDNFEPISTLYERKDRYDKLVQKIDINDNTTESIIDNKIYCRDVQYMNWLIKQFANKKEWYDILTEIVENGGWLSKEMFVAYNRMSLIARKTTKKEIDKIKRLGKYMNDDDLDDLIVDLVYKHYGNVLQITKNDVRKGILIADVIKDYRNILSFAIENIEYIEEIKNATDDGQRISACMKFDIAMKQRAESKRKQQISKTKTKTYTVRFKKNGAVRKFNGIAEMSEFFKTNERTIKRFTAGKKTAIGDIAEIIDIQ